MGWDEVPLAFCTGRVWWPFPDQAKALEVLGSLCLGSPQRQVLVYLGVDPGSASGGVGGEAGETVEGWGPASFCCGQQELNPTGGLGGWFQNMPQGCPTPGYLAMIPTQN